MRRACLACGLAVAIVSSVTLIPAPSFAKTVRACEQEWKANKATIEASGKKRKDFITECRAETAPAEPAKAAEQPAPAEQPKAAAATKGKTVKACAAEWMANKASLQASGKTRKEFFTECRGGTSTIAAAAPAEQPKAAAATKSKTVKACAADWMANKASLQASGKTRKDFITECRAGTSSTASAAPVQPVQPEQKPAEAAAPQPSQPEQKSAAAPAPQQAPAERPKSQMTTAPAAPLATGKFASEAEAKAHCPTDTIVWANTRSKVYHYASSRRYGHTKVGAYMCERETASAGIRAPKREKRL